MFPTERLSAYRKDDYAFFLKPVNPAAIPGYSDVIKRPMDLGTMTVKVQRGRYRSLEDFAVRFRAKEDAHGGLIDHAERLSSGHV